MLGKPARHNPLPSRGLPNPDWLNSLELDPRTVATYRGQAEKWIYPTIGVTKLKEFKATDPKRAAAALVAHRKLQAAERLAAGSAWQDNNLVFCHEDRRIYSKDALNWRFGKMTRRAGIGHWHAHERRTAVSIMSSNGVPLQDISDTVGHKSTHVTETVYRHVIVPAIRGGAIVMDSVFGEETKQKNGEADTAAMS